MTFSTEELRGILLEAGLSASAAAELARSIGAAASADELEAALFEQLSQGVPAAMLEIARDQANREAKRITGQILQAELNKIAQKVADNLEAGFSPEELARQLSEITGLDKNRAATYENFKAWLEEQDFSDAEIEAKLERMFEKLLRDRKRTIAATEQRMVTAEHARLKAEGLGQKYKRWITVGDNRVSDACQNNERAGWVGIDEAFPEGDQWPPNHPNCRCTVAYRTSEPDKQDEARAKQEAEETAAAKAA